MQSNTITELEDYKLKEVYVLLVGLLTVLNDNEVGKLTLQSEEASEEVKDLSKDLLSSIATTFGLDHVVCELEKESCKRADAITNYFLGEYGSTRNEHEDISAEHDSTEPIPERDEGNFVGEEHWEDRLVNDSVQSPSMRATPTGNVEVASVISDSPIKVVASNIDRMEVPAFVFAGGSVFFLKDRDRTCPGDLSLKWSRDRLTMH